MATPTTTLWDRDAHTAAKHDLLKQYLQAWTPILLSRFPRVTYAEGFSGPGVYRGGEPGSPVLALEVFLGRRGFLDDGKHLSMVMLDSDENRCARLDVELDKAITRHGQAWPVGLHRSVEVGVCADDLLDSLKSSNAFGQPIFAFLDSFGGPDVPFSLVQSIAKNPGSEVLVTFGPQFLIRFGEIGPHRASGDDAFGGSHWQGVASQPANAKRGYLENAYRETLRLAGFAFTLTFEMVDEGGHSLFLMFGTNNEAGLRKMKEALWKVDPVTGVRYRDPKDPEQELLDLEMTAEVGPLRRALLAQIGDAQCKVEDLRRFALLETVYREAHVIPALASLIKRGELRLAGSVGRVVVASVVERTGVSFKEAHDEPLF